MALLKVIAWAAAGALGAASLTWVGCILFFGPRFMFGPGDSDEIQAWSWFNTMVGSGLGAGVGFGIGALFGTVRGCVQKRADVG